MKLGRAATITAAVLALASCGGKAAPATSSPAAAGTPTAVRFVFDWPTPDFELIPVVIGLEKGFYKDARLDVAVSFPPDTATTVKVLGTGGGDIGLVTTTDMVAAVQSQVPITSIANYSQENNWGLFTKPGVAITLDTIKGKTISGFGDTWTQAMLPFVLKSAGLTDADVKQVVVTNDAPLLLSGKVDIATNTTNYLPPTVMESTGKEPGVLLAKDAGAPNVPIWVYAGQADFLKAHPDAAKAWLAATAKATQWAIDNPEAAVTAFETAYPKNGYSHAYNLAGWNATVKVLKDSAGALFTQTDTQWSDLANALVSVGALKKAAAPSAYYTNSYLGQ